MHVISSHMKKAVYMVHCILESAADPLFSLVFETGFFLTQIELSNMHRYQIRTKWDRHKRMRGHILITTRVIGLSNAKVR